MGNWPVLSLYSTFLYILKRKNSFPGFSVEIENLHLFPSIYWLQGIRKILRHKK
jgi:hypothetical protein